MSSQHQRNGETGRSAASPRDGSKDAPTDDNPARAESGERQESDRGKQAPREIGGRAGLDPTRYGDWEKNGRCIDF